MYPYTQRLLNQATTTRAHLAGILGIDRHDLNSGIDSLVVEHGAEHPQTNVVCRTGKVAVPKHELERHIFKSDSTVVINQLAGSLMPPIRALISDMLIQTGNLLNSLTSILSAPFLTGNRRGNIRNFLSDACRYLGLSTVVPSERARAWVIPMSTPAGGLLDFSTDCSGKSICSKTYQPEGFRTTTIFLSLLSGSSLCQRTFTNPTCWTYSRLSLTCAPSPGL